MEKSAEVQEKKRDRSVPLRVKSAEVDEKAKVRCWRLEERIGFKSGINTEDTETSGESRRRSGPAAWKRRGQRLRYHQTRYLSRNIIV